MPNNDGGGPSIVCTLCKFSTPIDDVAIAFSDGVGGICLGCYQRQISDGQPVDPKVRSLLREVQQTLEHTNS